MASFAPPERVLTDRQDDKVEAHSPYQLSDAELRPERESGPLKRPLTEGVLSFPFKACNVKPMIFLTFGFMVFGLQCALLNLILTNGGMFAAVAGGAMAIGMLWVVILTGSYACSVMVEVIQQTAAGNRTITYDGYEWRSGFFSFLRVAWVAFLGVALPGFALSLCLSWWPVIGIAPATFPVALLSSMATDSWIKLWDSRLMAQAFKKPHVIMATYLYGVVMAGLVAGAGYLSWTFALFAPVFGILCATCWLIYSLVLGRVGDVLTTGEARKRRRKKKRKKPGTDGAEGVGGTEGEQGSALEENAAKAEAKEPEPPETGQSHVKS